MPRHALWLLVATTSPLPAPVRGFCGYTCRQEQKEALAVAVREARSNYSVYEKRQLAKTDRLSSGGITYMQWVQRLEIERVVAYVRNHLPIQTRFALAHGVRSGREVLWFRDLLPEVQTWGTELSWLAASQAAWTIHHDFNVVRPEWIGSADFIYSNSLDHAFNVSKTLDVWGSQSTDSGAVMVHWSHEHESSETGETAVDLHRLNASELAKAIDSAGLKIVGNIRISGMEPAQDTASQQRGEGTDRDDRRVLILRRKGLASPLRLRRFSRV